MSEPSDESREMVRQWATRKIERLEAELAKQNEIKAKLVRERKDNEAAHYAQSAELDDLRAELADLRASSVVVRERCQTCEGGGQAPHRPDGAGRCFYCGEGGVWSDDPDDPYVFGRCEAKACLDCDNGWRLAEGVIHREDWSMPGGWYCFPARLIEGDTND